ncbi:MAG TPA: SRPBCC domain-containing protein [Pyrinomonadaceae bacterium]|nr:SRPBCC domain-containing protein [Pyrinomonadaceae bacterium]HMP65315.1 SRPBCC domain-containing protein [Pyrinomonadaceae bacterium]
MELKFKVQTKIQKPVAEVFDAVYNPDKLSGYFTNGGASAPLDEGTTVEWAFADNPGDEGFKFPVEVKRTVPNELIELVWEGAKGLNTNVRMEFEAAGEDETIVRISESGWRETQDDLNSSYLNCMGWSQMISALKAYAEHGINLRKGAYSGLYSASEHHGT